MNLKTERFRSRAYLMHVASLGCLICRGDAVPHHLLRGSGHGMGLKAPDNKIERLRGEMREFAGQPLVAEMAEHIKVMSDFEYAYEEFIRRARALGGDHGHD